MSDVDVADLGPVSWVRELFETATAESMYRWVLLAWIVVVGALVVLDRLGSSLLGRSRPFVQAPPVRARAWRWGRRTPPPQYSLLPPGTIAPVRRPIPALPESIPLVEQRALGPAPIAPEPVMIVAAQPWLQDDEFWPTLVDHACPIFGFENTSRLAQGLPPERFNPVSGRIEALERDQATGSVRWPDASGAPPVASSTTPDESAEVEALAE